MKKTTKTITIIQLIEQFKKLADIQMNNDPKTKEKNSNVVVMTEDQGCIYTLQYNQSFGYIFGLVGKPESLITLPYLEEDNFEELIEDNQTKIEEYLRYNAENVCNESFNGTVIIETIQYSAYAVVKNEISKEFSYPTTEEELKNILKDKNCKLEYWECGEIINKEGDINIPFTGKTKKEVINKLQKEYQNYLLEEYVP